MSLRLCDGVPEATPAAQLSIGGAVSRSANFVVGRIIAWEPVRAWPSPNLLW